MFLIFLFSLVDLNKARCILFGREPVVCRQQDVSVDRLELGLCVPELEVRLPQVGMAVLQVRLVNRLSCEGFFVCRPSRHLAAAVFTELKVR